jgi:fructose-1-phosphate kinase PfkB-like protein
VLAGRVLRDEAEVRAFGADVLECGPDAVSITRGDAGSWLVYSDGLEAFPALNLDEVMDATGCGDVFLAGFTLEFVRSGDVRAASRFAHRVAGMNCCLRGIEEVGGLGAVKGMRNGSLVCGSCLSSRSHAPALERRLDAPCPQRKRKM